MRRFINGMLGRVGLELRRVSHTVHLDTPVRLSLDGGLQHLSRLNLIPKTVIDVGAADGTLELYRTFPQAHHALLEPLVEFQPSLEKLTSTYPHLDYKIAAAGRTSGEMTINVHPDLYGSSFYLEQEDSDVNGAPRTVPMVTLDEWCGHLPGPYLVKIDVQGAELEVLAGAERVLQETQFIVMETSLFEFYKGAPLVHDVVRFMSDRNFVLYDILGLQYRLLDHALSQVDLAFVPAHSPLRRDQSYATPEQRRKQTVMFQHHLQQQITRPD